MVATTTRRLVLIGDAADTLAVSTRTVRRYISDGQLEAVRLGRKTLRIKGRLDRALHRCPAGGQLVMSFRRAQPRPGRGPERSNGPVPCSPYVPENGKRPSKGPLTCIFMVGDTGFEPVTSSVSRKRATAAPIALDIEFEVGTGFEPV